MLKYKTIQCLNLLWACLNFMVAAGNITEDLIQEYRLSLYDHLILSACFVCSKFGFLLRPQ